MFYQRNCIILMEYSKQIYLFMNARTAMLFWSGIFLEVRCISDTFSLLKNSALKFLYHSCFRDRAKRQIVTSFIDICGGPFSLT